MINNTILKMDIYSSTIPNTHGLIRTMFIILATSVIIGGILFFTLDIQETVKVSNGQLFSDNAPMQYLSPVEADVKKIFVSEGDAVNIGDTILILTNEDLNAEFETIKKEQKLKSTNLYLLRKKIKNLDNKLNIQSRELKYLDGDLNTQRKSLEYELSSLEKQLNSLKLQLEQSKLTIKKEYDLFKMGALSEREYREKEKAYQEENNYIFSIENKYLQTKNTLENHPQSKSSSIEKQNLSIISSKSQRIDLENRIAQEDSELQRLDQRKKSIENDLDKLVIISQMNGFASSIFNIRKDLNFVSKGQPLVTINPKTENEFYANLQLNEKEMKDIKIGQKTKIKVDAYNHYQHGFLVGEIIQITKDELNMFYVTADIKNEKNFDLKSGYKVSGEVILDNVKLSNYVKNMLFRKI